MEGWKGGIVEGWNSSIVVMGVSGCGKSTLGRELAERLGGRFLEGDEYHPEENLARMSAGKPLRDSDRKPWLERLNRDLREGAKEGSQVLACSALKRSYREILQRGLDDCVFVYLQGSYETLHRRMENREHFMPPELLQSQFDTLEEPEDAIVVPVELPLEEQVEAVLRSL